jgi:hypothetical protein
MSEDEAGVFGRYLLGSELSGAARELYVRASHELNYDTDDPVTRFASARPWSIAALDGALALIDPDALLRKKVLLMAAVLESRPEYCDAFLPRDRSLRDAFSIAVAVVRAGLLAATGLLLLRFVR